MRHVKHIKATVNPTIGTDAYTAGDVVGGLLTFTFSGLTVNGGILNQLIMVDEDNVGGTLTLYLFEEAPDTIADDAAFASAISIDDMNKLIGIHTLPSPTTVNSIDFYHTTDINDVFTTTNNSIYGFLVDSTGGTWTNADALTIRLYAISE